LARRASWRIPIRLNVELNCQGKVSSGTVTNLSENGMFINTRELDYTEGSQFDISILLKDKTLTVPAKLVRTEKISGSSEGIGVELQNPPQNYLDFVENLLFVL
jgi:hypothetical protein